MSNWRLTPLLLLAACSISDPTPPEPEVTRLGAIEKAGEEQLAAFDLDLDANPQANIFQRPAYAKLWAVRSMREEELEKLDQRDTTPRPSDPASIAGEVDSKAQDIARNWPSDLEPSVTGPYQPSTGAQGTISGREFKKGTWAITYDDGPAKQTPLVLNELKKRGLFATFFWLSSGVATYKSTHVARAKAEGHELANHSETHAQLTKVSATRLDREILGSTNSLNSSYGQNVRFFRLPYGDGVNVPEIRTRIAQAKLIHVLWNVDSLDWQDKNPDSIHERVKKQMASQGRGIILFHDVHDQSVVASAKVMDTLKSGGARIVTIPEAIDILNGVKP